eukprot:TRINITY_DN26956_c0_g1_i1.p1 TRINITY_DN26956_c0_g1~~TRINITY_DN26956_c0_g1_i1.p1  ORF type:complete len:817 (-),score=153.74 TRINITY_DN26956_c0_g1_i1:375-2825(-)
MDFDALLSGLLTDFGTTLRNELLREVDRLRTENELLKAQLGTAAATDDLMVALPPGSAHSSGGAPCAKKAAGLSEDKPAREQVGSHADDAALGLSAIEADSACGGDSSAFSSDVQRLSSERSSVGPWCSEKSFPPLRPVEEELKPVLKRSMTLAAPSERSRGDEEAAPLPHLIRSHTSDLSYWRQGSKESRDSGGKRSARARISSLHSEPCEFGDSVTRSASRGDLSEIGGESPSAAKKHRPSGAPVQWSWEHRTGFRPYAEEANERIEDSFWCGEERVRLKSGKDNCVPMEVWYADMIQYDPTTGNKRKIKRSPPPSVWMRVRRFVLSYLHGKHGSFAQYEKLRNQLVHKWDKGLLSARSAKKNGMCARATQTLTFSFCSYSAAVLSTIWVGVDAELNTSGVIYTADLHFQVVEYLFTVYFALELILRFGSFERKRDCLWDPWFRLDAILVAMSFFETCILPILVITDTITLSSQVNIAGDMSGLRILRLLRLARIGRISRLLRQVPALVIMTRGVIAAGGSVGITLVMMVSLLYIFAIIFKMQADDLPDLSDKFFPSLWVSMRSLLLHGAFMDSPSLVLKHPDMSDSIFLTFSFLTFIFLSCFVVLNLLVGVLCDVVADVSRQEKEESDILFLRNTIVDMLPCYDKNDDGHLGKEEIDLLLQNPEMRVALNRFGVNVQGLVLSLDMYLENLSMEELPEQLTFQEFLEFVMRLRAVKHTTVMDLVDLRDYLRQRLDLIERKLGIADDAAPEADNDEHCSEKVEESKTESSDPLSIVPQLSSCQSGPSQSPLNSGPPASSPFSFVRQRLPGLISSR